MQMIALRSIRGVWVQRVLLLLSLLVIGAIVFAIIKISSHHHHSVVQHDVTNQAATTPLASMSVNHPSSSSSFPPTSPLRLPAGQGRTTAPPSSSTVDDKFFSSSPGPTTTTSTTMNNIDSIITDVVAKDAEDGAISNGGVCYVIDAHDFVDAINHTACSIIILANVEDPYVLHDEVIISHAVTIQGNSFTLPFIDCREAIRCFRVVAGGYLMLRHVQMNQGKGIRRPRFASSAAAAKEAGGGAAAAEEGPQEIVEKRGGSIFIEPQARGGIFVGLYFDNDETSPHVVDVLIRWQSHTQAIEEVIELIVTDTPFRAYGGMLFVAGGELTFIGCFFWDNEIITPVDVIYYGGSVLVLAGQVEFIGCVWLFITAFGFENGMGFANAHLGGIATYSFCSFDQASISICMAGVGEIFFLGGGVQIVTGASLMYANVMLFFAGAGQIIVTAGVQILTGIDLVDMTPIMAVFGTGFNYCVGAGLLIHAGTASHVWNALLATYGIGGYSFVGTGVSIAIGAVAVGSAAISYFAGMSSYHAVGSGIAIFIGCPCVAYSAIASEAVFGQFIALGAGFLVWIGSPMISFAAIDEIFGYGASLFVGAGSAVLGYTPLISIIPITRNVRDFWIEGVCDPIINGQPGWARGPPFFVKGGSPSNCSITRRLDIPPEMIDRRVLKGRLLGDQNNPLFSNLSFSQEDLSKIGLLAFNLTRPHLNLTDNALMQSLSSFIPTSIIQAANMTQRMLLRLNANRTTGAEEEGLLQAQGVSMQISGPIAGSCQICGVESVEGQGAVDCEYESATCKGLSHPFSKPSNLFSWDDLEFNDHFIMLGEIEATFTNATATTTATANDESNRNSSNNSSTQTASTTSTTIADFQEALRYALISQGLKGIEDDVVGLQITMWESEIDPLFASIFPPSFPSRHLTEEHSVTQRYKVGIVTTANHSLTSVINAINGSTTTTTTTTATPPSTTSTANGMPEVFQINEVANSMKNYLIFEKNMDIGYLGLSYDKNLHIPAYNSKSVIDTDKPRSYGIASISLIDPLRPALPLMYVEYDKIYTIHIQESSPNGGEVMIELFVAPDHESGSHRQETKTVGYKLLDNKGSAEMNHIFTPLTSPAGSYYFKATEVKTGKVGLSQLYILTSQPVKRNLYGPLRWNGYEDRKEGGG